MGVPADVMNEELSQVNKSHFKQMYKEKEFMEEMLKAKNMMGNKHVSGGPTKWQRSTWKLCKYYINNL